MKQRKRILVAPLNWGLGHASRCVPLINAIVQRGHEVVIAAEGKALLLLQNEFPDLEAIHLEGLKIRYPKKGNFTLHFALKLPKLFKLIRKENAQLKQMIKEHQIDAVISDNRYGLYSSEIPTVLITHQLFIESPFLKNRLYRIIKKMVLQFSHCWVPDYAGVSNLSGKLSHANAIPKNVSYIGPLSRFSKEAASSYEREILVVLSGPEPHRSYLEEAILPQLDALGKKFLLVRGVVEESKREEKRSDAVTVVNFLTSKELEKEMKKSELIVCRSGYSSVMDLVKLQKKALLIPTKGQAEQEYLAKHLQEIQLFYSVESAHLNLENDIEKARSFDQNFPKLKENFSYLDEFLKSV